MVSFFKLFCFELTKNNLNNLSNLGNLTFWIFKAIIFCVGIKTYKKQGLGWKRIKTTFFIFWYFCRKAALWEAYREKFCDSEFFCWYLVLFSFGQQDGYEVKSVRALGKIMRPQPLFWSWLRPERKCVYDSKGISYFAKNRKCKHIFTHFLHMFTHFYTCVSGFFWVYTCVSGFFGFTHV